jgi:hypothetical protein
MPSNQRRAADIRRTWGRKPIILRFETLEDRELRTGGLSPDLPDLVGLSIAKLPSANWGDTVEVSGNVWNQGRAPANKPYIVSVYASATPILTGKSVKLGEISMPAGLQPYQTAAYDQTFTLPEAAIPQFNGRLIYIDTWVNPNHQVRESNYHNNFDIGLRHDVSPVLIEADQPSNLIGTSLGVSSSTVSWGGTVTVAAQIRNDAQGDAPATMARIVLTPQGALPGTLYNDVTVGYINVPAIPAWQTVNVETTITLPTTIPNPLVGSTNFTLSMIQDSNYLTNPLYPHEPSQGPGKDETAIAIDPTSTTVTTTATTQSDIAVGTVKVPTTAVGWGQSFNVETTIQNLGSVATGQFNVDYVLTGGAGNYTQGIFLGQTTIQNMNPGDTQIVNQTVSLPARLPNGVSLPSTGVGEVVVIADPNTVVNETMKTNNIAYSNPLGLRVMGADGQGTVPTDPPIELSPTTPTPTPTPAAADAHHTIKFRPHKLRRHAALNRDYNSTVNQKISEATNDVENFFKNLVKGKL